VFRSDEIEVADELLQEAERHGAGGHIKRWWLSRKAKRWDGLVTALGADDLMPRSIVLDRGRAYGAKIGALAGNCSIQVESGFARPTDAGYWLDTSSTAAYEPTRAFYRRCGYRMLSEISDFYRVTDGKIIFGKRLDRP